MPHLVDVLVEELGPALTVPAGCAEQLDTWMAEAHRRWPRLHPDDADFVRHLAHKARETETGLDQIARLHAVDLYLAYACLIRCAGSAEYFEAEYGSVIDRSLSRVRVPEDSRRDQAQELRIALLVGDVDRRPLLADFTGRGTLRSWLSAVAVHAGLKLTRSRGRVVPLRDGDIPVQVDPWLLELKETYAQAFREAVADSIAAMETRDKNLIRQYYLDRLTIDDLARLYRVHRSTAARWLERVRERVVAHTRARLARRLDISESHMASVIRLIQSRLDASIARVLNDEP